jgi:hypothetical protein
MPSIPRCKAVGCERQREPGRGFCRHCRSQEQAGVGYKATYVSGLPEGVCAEFERQHLARIEAHTARVQAELQRQGREREARWGAGGACRACGKSMASGGRGRGFCRSCYDSRRWKVRTNQTTWEQVEAELKAGREGAA